MQQHRCRRCCCSISRSSLLAGARKVPRQTCKLHAWPGHDLSDVHHHPTDALCPLGGSRSTTDETHEACDQPRGRDGRRAPNLWFFFGGGGVFKLSRLCLLSLNCTFGMVNNPSAPHTVTPPKTSWAHGTTALRDGSSGAGMIRGISRCLIGDLRAIEARWFVHC